MKTTRSVGSHLASLAPSVDDPEERQRRELRLDGEALVEKIRVGKFIPNMCSNLQLFL